MQFSQLTAWALMLLTVSPMAAAHANPAAHADDSALEARALPKPKPPVKPPVVPAPKPTAKPTAAPKPTTKPTSAPKPTSKPSASAKPSTLSTVTKSSSAAPRPSSSTCRLKPQTKKPALAKRVIPATVTCGVELGAVDRRESTTYTDDYLQLSLTEGLRHTECGTQAGRYPFAFANTEKLALDKACGTGPYIEFPLWDTQTKVWGLTGLRATFDADGEVSNMDTKTQLRKIERLADRVIFDDSGNFCGVTTHRGHRNADGSPNPTVHLCT